jgi:predicted DCC family thiol-disulfide oxidoreductase YuxK
LSATSPDPSPPPAPPAATGAATTFGGPTPFGGSWSGGQWSVARVLFSLYLLGHFAVRVDRSAPLVSVQNGVAALAVLASVFLAFGSFTRGVAALLLLVGGWMLWSESVAPRAAAYGFLLPLLACLLAPAAPYGSLAARGRVDPDGGWRLPAQLFALLWVGVAAISLASALVKLQALGRNEGATLSNGVAVAAGFLFAPLALFRKTRPLAWVALLLRHVAALPLAGLRDEHLGMAATLLFLFDPAWLPPAATSTREVIFFDGYCGLCHRLIRFVLAEDRLAIFGFSPLQGAAIRTVLSDEARARLPDSVVVKDASGQILIKSTAVAHVYDRLGGFWRVAAWLLHWIPRPLRDLGYDGVAKLRRHLFKRPDDACPVMPPALRQRFIA